MEEVTIKIAVFGRKEIIERVEDCVKEQQDIEIIPFIYTKEIDVNLLIDQAFMCDIYLFTTPLSYLHAKEKIQKKRLPAVQITFDEYMVLTSFYRVRNYEKQELKRISIDIHNGTHVTEVLSELEMLDRAFYTYSYNDMSQVNIDQIVSHHVQLWEAGKIDYALTSIIEVDKQLKQRAIPSSCMIIPKTNILHAMEQAKSLVTFNKSQSAQIVAGYARIKHLQEIEKIKGIHKVRELQSKLSSILVRFTEKTYATLLTNNENQFVLFGTRGILDHITNHYRDFPLLQEIETRIKVPVEIGFGLGLTAKQAEDHAQQALDISGESEGSSCYIVNDRQDIIGPLGVKKHFDTSRLYQALIHKARLNNELSYNFIDFVTLRNNEPFSSHDVATYYRVTKRSAERTINKLLIGDVIKVVGEEKPYVKGRPRKLFQINM